MDYIKILGLVAGFCTTLAFLPQVIKTWKEKSAEGLSLGMFSIFCIGLVLWLVYGLIIKDLAVTLSNLITLMLASMLLFFKLKFKN